MAEFALDWDDLRMFLMIARHGPLSGATWAPGLRQPAMARRLEALELRAGPPKALVAVASNRWLMHRAAARLNPGAAARLNPGAAARVNPGAAARLNPGATARLIPGAEARFNPGAAARLNPDQRPPVPD